MPDFLETTFTEPTDLPETLSGTRSGTGNSLHQACTAITEIIPALQALLAQSPGLQQAIASVLSRKWNIDPRLCGVQRGITQVSLLDMSAFLIASPAFSNLFTDGWTTYGVDTNASVARLSGADWVHHINALKPGRSVEQVYSAYWAQRMPGHAHSRMAHGKSLLQQHFTHSLDLAYGLGHIDEHAWQQGHAASTWAAIYWEHPGKIRELAQATVVVQPLAEDDQWLLYRPGDTTTLRAYADRAALESGLNELRSTLWPDLPTTEDADSTSGALVISPLEESAFGFVLKQLVLDHEERALPLLEQACLEQTRDQKPGSLDWQSITDWEQRSSLRLVAPLAEETSALIHSALQHEQQLAEQQLHFDALSPMLPLLWRTSRVAAHQAAIERYVGNDTAVTASAMVTLRTLEEALEQHQENTSRRLEQLPDTLSAADWREHVEGTPRFDFISNSLAEALLAEARLQQTLGELSDAQFTLIEAIVAQPEYTTEHTVEVAKLELVVGHQHWPLHGFLSFRPAAGTTTQEDGVLLYRSGRDGGLKAFADETHLTQALLESLSGLWPNTLIDSVEPASSPALLEALASSEQPARLESTLLTTHCFDHCVQTIIEAVQPENAEQTEAPAYSRTWLSALLSIPRNEARTQAFNAIAEQNRTENIVNQLATPLNRLSAEEKSALVTGLQQYRQAMAASINCLEHSLPERTQFIRNRLAQQLRKDLGLATVPNITVNLPNNVAARQEPVVGSGQPHATKTVFYPSEARSDVPLENLLLGAIDEDLLQRMNYMRFAFDPPETGTHLSTALTSAYLLRLDKTLDLAGAYEQAILEAFNGKEGDSAMAREWRDEILRRPFALSLELLALSKPKRLDNTGYALLRDTAAGVLEWTPLILNPGIAADGSSNAVALSGVFLLKSTSHNTVVLYLPEAPNGRIVSQYPNATSACQALEQMALDSTMLDWVATRPVAGDPEQHRSYINRALLKNFSGFIVPGERQSLSLATHLSRLQMGRLITQHRQTARSQRELYLEEAAIRHNRVYDYIQLCLSFVPGVGIAVGLYDGWNASTAAVEAFMRGQYSQGVEHLNSVVLSIIDALLDIAPGATPSGRIASARAYTRLRQAQTQRTTLGKTARAASPDPFKGYETEMPMHTALLDSAGYTRNTLALDGKRYISRYGRYYEVQWDATYNTWRLKGNALKHYKQPIRLSEDGIWETHGHLSGVLVEGGLQGGGQAFGRLYNNGLETLHGYLRRLRLDAIEQPMDELRRMRRETDQHTDALAASIQEARNTSAIGEPAVPAQIRRAYQDAITVCQRFVEHCDHCLQTLNRLKPSINRQLYRRLLDEYLTNASNQNLLLIQLRDRTTRVILRNQKTLDTELEALINSQPTDVEANRARLHAHRNSIRNNSKQMLEQFEALGQAFDRHLNLRRKLQGPALSEYDTRFNSIELLLGSPQAYRLAKLDVQSSLLVNFDHSNDIDFNLFYNQFKTKRRNLVLTLLSHHQLQEADLSRARYGETLRALRGQYTAFTSYLDVWSDNFPLFINAETVTSFRSMLTQLVSEIDNTLLNYRLPERRAGRRSTARVFQTDDQQLLIGRQVDVNGEERMVVNAIDDTYAESFRRIDGDRWQSMVPVRSRTIDPSRIKELQTRAREQLASITEQKARWQRYMATDMAPASLQNIAEHYATNLRERARDLQDALGDRATSDQRQLMQRLKDAAKNLDLHGKELRIAKIKTTRQPNIGQLQFLQEQNAVEARWGRILEPKKDSKGRPIEYLEEYEVIDLAANTVLWYAHFHFPQRPGSGFRKLSAGHLKVRSERSVLNAWHGPINEAEAMQLFGGLRPAAE
ncbi:dermonecrotic toxin domain-containing protein [Pseudomonas defluvii]|uniref:dermonecrotic toxin domain-containing protein n=1 Tax=Pseudomonas defluvii TaxID=1876757 RepID=UPI00390656EE